MSELKASVYIFPKKKVWKDDNMDNENIVLVHDASQRCLHTFHNCSEKNYNTPMCLTRK